MPVTFITQREDYIRCDVRNYRQIEKVFNEYGPFDYVYHLAAEYGRWNGEDYYENLWQTNVIGTKHMIRFQEKNRFRMIFFYLLRFTATMKSRWTNRLWKMNP